MGKIQTPLQQFEERLETKKNGLEYCQGKIDSPHIEEWEKKEYRAVMDDYEKEIPELEEHIEFLESEITRIAIAHGEEELKREQG